MAWMKLARDVASLTRSCGSTLEGDHERYVAASDAPKPITASAAPTMPQIIPAFAMDLPVMAPADARMVRRAGRPTPMAPTPRRNDRIANAPATSAPHPL